MSPVHQHHSKSSVWPWHHKDWHPAADLPPPQHAPCKSAYPHTYTSTGQWHISQYIIYLNGLSSTTAWVAHYRIYFPIDPLPTSGGSVTSHYIFYTQIHYPPMWQPKRATKRHTTACSSQNYYKALFNIQLTERKFISGVLELQTVSTQSEWKPFITSRPQ